MKETKEYIDRRLLALTESKKRIEKYEKQQNICNPKESNQTRVYDDSEEEFLEKRARVLKKLIG
jgi:hypothetical protein